MSGKATPANKFYLMNKDKPQYCAVAMETASETLKSDGWVTYYKFADAGKDCSLFSFGESDQLMVASAGTGTSVDYYVSVKDNGSADDKEVIITKKKPDPTQAFAIDGGILKHTKSAKLVQSRDASAGDGSTAFGSVLVVKESPKTGAAVEFMRKMYNEKGELVEYTESLYNKAKSFWEQHKTKIIVAIVVLVLLGVGWYMYSKSKKSKKSSGKKQRDEDDDNEEPEEVDDNDDEEPEEEEKPKKKKKAMKKKKKRDDDDE